MCQTEVESNMRIAPASRENARELDTVFAITEAVMGFVPDSMLVMARDPELLAAFAELAAIIIVRPGRVHRFMSPCVSPLQQT